MICVYVLMVDIYFNVNEFYINYNGIIRICLELYKRIVKFKLVLVMRIILIVVIYIFIILLFLGLIFIFLIFCILLSLRIFFGKNMMCYILLLFVV